MRYELMRLVQLAFSLAVMFSAFAGGLAAGWYRWGRRSVGGAELPSAAPPGELFTPDPGFPPSSEVDLRDEVPIHATFAPGALPPRTDRPNPHVQEEPSR